MIPTLVHVLGRADFLAEGDSVATSVSQLRAGGGTARRKALTSTQSQHHGGAPLENLMLEVERAVHPAPLPTVRILLVATSQDPADTGDTLPLAELIAEEIRHHPTLYGARAHAEIVTVPSVGAEATRRVVASALHGHHPVFVGLAGGPTTTTVGVLLACADAGAVPHLLESRDSNSQHAPLLASPSVERYLARSRQYGTARSPGLSPLHSVLHRYQTLNLAGLPAALTAASIPDTVQAVLRVPPGERGATKARRAAGAAVLAALCRNSWTDALFIERWLRARHAELEARLGPAERKSSRQLLEGLGRRGAVQGSLVKRLGNSGTWRKVLRNLPPDASEAAMREQILAAVTSAIDNSILFARRDANRADGFETLHEMPDRRPVLDHLPRPLVDLHGSSEFRALWRLRNEAHHGGHDRGAQLARYANFLCLDEDPILDACAAAGTDLPRAPVGPRAQLVLMAVGNRNEQDGAYPMLVAVEAATLSGAKACHLRTLSSEELLGAAERQLLNSSKQWASTDLISTPLDFASRTQAAVVDSVLRDRSLTTVDGITVAVGPGTKAMNVGLLMAAFELAVIVGAEVYVVELARNPGSSLTEVRPLHADRELASQFIDPMALAAPLRHCLERAEFGAALDLLEIGPARWRLTLRPLLDELLGAFTNPSANRQAVRDALLICRRRAPTDPVGAIAHADHLLAKVDLSSAKITRWRNEILHGRTDNVPSAKDIEAELAAALRELGTTTSRLVAQYQKAVRLLDQFVAELDEATLRALDLTALSEPVETESSLELEPDPSDETEVVRVLLDHDHPEIDDHPEFDEPADLGEPTIDHAAVGGATGADEPASEVAEVASAEPERPPHPPDGVVDELALTENGAVELVNLTPHELRIFCDNGSVLTLPPAETPARVQAIRVNPVTLSARGGEIRVASVVVGNVVDLPLPRPSTLYVVSRLVAERSPGEHLIVPDELVRDATSGAVIGCRSFVRSGHTH